MFEGGFLLSFQSGSLHSLNSVLTRLGGIWLEDSAKSRVTVGEKAWEAVSFPGGEFFRQNMRSGQKVGQQVLLWVAHVRKSVGSIKSRHKLCKKGTIGISSKVSQHTLIVWRSIPLIARRCLHGA